MPKHKGKKKRLSETLVKHKQRKQTDLVKRVVGAEQRWRCKNCKQYLDGFYELDHKVPWSICKSSKRTNLQALCSNCHAEKSALEAAGFCAFCKKKQHSKYFKCKQLQVGKNDVVRN